MGTGRGSYFFEKVLHEIKKDRILYYYIVLTCSVFYLLSLNIDDNLKIKLDVSLYVSILFKVCYYTFLSWCTYYYFYLLFNRVKSPTKVFVAKVKSLFNPAYRAMSFVLLVLAFNFIFSSYTYLKSIIPDINYFQYDLVFYELDKLIHFGVSPWEITHSIITTAWGSFVINFIYHLWFFLMWGCVLYFILNRKEHQLRTQFLLSFLSCWLFIGGLFATLLSSAGPCYSHLIDTTSDHYLPLLKLLNDQSRQLVDFGFFPLWALDVQDMLWQTYLNRGSGVGSGISAMPSMHVSISVLMALSLSKVNRYLGYGMWVFALVIQIGSVHLAWHYAVDGYVSFILTTAVWVICGKIAQWQKPYDQ